MRRISAWRYRKSAGDNALVPLILMLVFVVPFLGILVGADLFLNSGFDHPRVRLIHQLALPFEWVLAAGILLAAYAGCFYLTLALLVPLTRALLVVMHGRSSDGRVVKHLHTTVGVDADGDPTRSEHWQVEFTDTHGMRHLIEYSPSTQPRHPIAVGTILRTRYQRNRPENAWVHRPGPGPIIGAGAMFVLSLVVWACLAIAPAAFLVWAFRWAFGLLSST